MFSNFELWILVVSGFLRLDPQIFAAKFYNFQLNAVLGSQ
jgi:hypothetical protein